ncbi:hypothetical protein J4Q44_G00393610 [Coregonus suidteri]|uniref:Uncharacterized protein n=1 Tax=Coregonus suidteri TaxID=861788 RepID=A0AAN8KEN3_9TELE
MKGLPSREERQATAEWEPSVEPEVTLESDSCEEPEDHPSPGDRVREKTEERRLRQVRLVEWCTDCGSEPTLTCTTRRHKKLYVCGVWEVWMLVCVIASLRSLLGLTDSAFFYFFISPLFNQVSQLRTRYHLQLRPGQDKAKQCD